VICLLKTLGWTYLGNWHEQEGNANVEESQLRPFLREVHGLDDDLIDKALFQLRKEATAKQDLYAANKEVYGLLRYGLTVSPGLGEKEITVNLIDWKTPERNRFAVAEEVTVDGEHDKRPDLVLYVNGIALGVLELKRSTVSVGEGIRQGLESQKAMFIQSFFATVQMVMAGNDTEGLRYGVIQTPEKYMLTWKEPSAVDNPLDRAVGQICAPKRFLELIHDFTVFDAGTKKTARHNQYFGVRAAQEFVQKREGGVIWHTQGSGKSLTMVWLAKWIRENVSGSRVLVVTDRNELDEQIEKVFAGVDEHLHRAASGKDLLAVLNESKPWLIGSLVHKFGKGDEGDVDGYLAEITKAMPKDFRAKGELFVFVDECHRTQAGKLHKAMKALLPGATFIGFTGTPLLKQDKETSLETFGPYIHTYKFDEAVRDGVVLDLRYEARDIDQTITAQDKIDLWFEAKTKGLNDIAKGQLKERWGTMRKVLSSLGRLQKIVADVLLDFETKDRLMSGHGNAMLVSDSVYNACRLYELFEPTPLKGKVAIVTSYRAGVADVKGEDSGEGNTEKMFKYDIYQKMLGGQDVDAFEKEVKRKFIKEPGQMKLLIVVDKLLTGFDAPSATYLYIDKQMRDHALFQAICRVNRLDGEDKEYGYIVDYKDLFNSIEGAFNDYTKEAFESYDKEDIAGLLSNRLEKAQEKLEDAIEAIRALCEDVEPPRDQLAYQRHFCPSEIGTDADRLRFEQRRVALYTLTASLIRAYANIAGDMPEVGYGEPEIIAISQEVSHWTKVRDEIRLASGDFLDMKQYEPAMRHLIDSYIRAEDSQIVSTLDDLSLVQLLVDRVGILIDRQPQDTKRQQASVAESIENNIRKTIIDERAANPKYYDRMSLLLDALIQERRLGAIEYAAYLAKIVELTRQVQSPSASGAYPSILLTREQRALYDNLGKDEVVALQLDAEIRRTKKADWRGHPQKEREVRGAIRRILADDDRIDEIFALVKAQRDY
jgi:type I restriction enzyme R subunit